MPKMYRSSSLYPEQQQNLVYYGQFIEEVKRYPSLYNPSIQGYRDVQFSDVIWKRIADAMNVEGIDGREWKKKWRNLRDTYVKKRREGAMGSSKKWWLMDELAFLEPFIAGKSVSGASFDGAPVDLDIKPSLWTDQPEPMADDSNGSSYGEHSYTTVDSQGTATLDRPRKHRRTCSDSPATVGKHSPSQSPSTMTSAGDSNPYFPDTTCGAPLPPVVDNAENAFFYSCSLRAQRLSPHARSLLMLQVAQLFYGAENPELVIPMGHVQNNSDSTPK